MNATHSTTWLISGASPGTAHKAIPYHGSTNAIKRFLFVLAQIKVDPKRIFLGFFLLALALLSGCVSPPKFNKNYVFVNPQVNALVTTKKKVNGQWYETCGQPAAVWISRPDSTIWCDKSWVAIPAGKHSIKVSVTNRVYGTYESIYHVAEFKDVEFQAGRIYLVKRLGSKFLIGSEPEGVAQLMNVPQVRGDYNGQAVMTGFNDKQEPWIYEGTLTNGWRHGRGIFQWKNGTYCGEFREDQYHGAGTFTWTNRDVYAGEWREDKVNGQGTMTWISGDVYNGGWKDDAKHGQGKLSCSDGTVYDGVWMQDRYIENSTTGLQKVVSIPQNKVVWRYEGGFKSGKLQGQGSIVFADGQRYTGEFQADQYHGQGTFIWTNGSSYSGSWTEGKKQGYGTYTLADGARYTGEFHADHCHGNGTLTSANGTAYAGTWSNSLYFSASDGIATVVSLTGAGMVFHYKGELKQYHFHGQGCLTWLNGDRYTGEFKDGSLEGQGVLILSTGKIYDGRWARNCFFGESRDGHASVTQFVGSQVDWNYEGTLEDGLKSGTGTFVYASSDTYYGEWEKDKKHGQGKLSCSDGTVYDGVWMQDRYIENSTTGLQKVVYIPQNKVVWRYEGGFKSGKLQGQGSIVFADGQRYTGEFQADQYHGQGTFIWTDGSSYSGSWTEGKKQGYGTYTLANGDCYTGEYKNDSENGIGSRKTVGGWEYTGEYKDGKRHGQGVLLHMQGNKFAGLFKDNSYSRGTYTYENGEVYEGEFSDGKRNGYGKFTDMLGNVRDGMWKDDVFVGRAKRKILIDPK